MNGPRTQQNAPAGIASFGSRVTVSGLPAREKPAARVHRRAQDAGTKTKKLLSAVRIGLNKFLQDGAVPALALAFACAPLNGRDQDRQADRYDLETAPATGVVNVSLCGTAPIARVAKAGHPAMTRRANVIMSLRDKLPGAPEI